MALHFSATGGACGNRPLSRRAPIFDLALERIRRREAAVRFAWLLYELQVAFLIAWYPATWCLWSLEVWTLVEDTPLMLVMLAFFTVCLALWLAIMGRRNSSERCELERLRHELTDR
jgi:hypothetical protein